MIPLTSFSSATHDTPNATEGTKGQKSKSKNSKSKVLPPEINDPRDENSASSVGRLVIELKNSLRSLEYSLNDLSLSLKFYEANKRKLNQLQGEIEVKKKYLFQMHEEIEKMRHNLSLAPEFIRRRHSFCHYPSPSSSTRSYERTRSYNCNMQMQFTPSVLIDLSMQPHPSAREEHFNQTCPTSDHTTSQALPCRLHSNHHQSHQATSSGHQSSNDHRSATTCDYQLMDSVISTLPERESDSLNEKLVQHTSNLSSSRNSSSANGRLYQEARATLATVCFKLVMVVTSILVLSAICIMILNSLDGMFFRVFS